MEKEKTVNAFEVRKVSRDFPFKLSTADSFNEHLYLGDEKGTLHCYPILASDAEVIPKSANQLSKTIQKGKIDKLLCYSKISLVITLSNGKLYVLDANLKSAEMLAEKVYDFAINNFVQANGLYTLVVVTKKKEGLLYLYDSQLGRFEESKSRFQLTELPTCIDICGFYIAVSYKKEYETLNIEKAFAVKKGLLQPKTHPILKVTGPNEILFFNEDIGIFMDPQFNLKQKDNIFVNRPILEIKMSSSFCFLLCDNLLQIYATYDKKKFLLVQEIPLLSPKGVTNNRPFIYNREDMSFLFQIPYETQIRSLLEKCRLQDAINLLMQNNPKDFQTKLQELKINAVWPLIRKMQFNQVKDILKSTGFDIRQVILLFPEYVSPLVEGLRSKADKTFSTMILQYLNQRQSRSKDDQEELKNKSKLFLKQILEHKRQQFRLQSSMSSKIKMQFYTSKSSFVKQKLPAATIEEFLEIIDCCLLKWYLDRNAFKALEEWVCSISQLYCIKLYSEFEPIIKSSPKMIEVPTLRPRLFGAFKKQDEAFQGWQSVAQSNAKEQVITIACEEAVKLLAQFDDRSQVYSKLNWILQKRPQVGMNFFKMVDLNFIQPQEIIQNFESQRADKYLLLYLQIIVFDKHTPIESYHTKLLLIYIDLLFKRHPKSSKQECKEADFQEQLKKMRKFLKNPDAKYASEAVLKKIENCPWLLEDEVYLYSRQKRHEEALNRYISRRMDAQAQQYCRINKDQTLTIYFKMRLAMYRSYEQTKNQSPILLQKDIITFLKRYANNAELDPIVVLDLIPNNWKLNDSQSMGGIYQFLESAIIHMLHQKRATYTSKHLSEMDMLNAEYNLIQAKKAHLKFTYKKKCCICDAPIIDKFFVVYPNANVCHQACSKKQKSTICPVTKQDFEKTFKY